MDELIPEPILQRIEQFTAEGRTGQIALNVYQGAVVSAEVKEHIKGQAQKPLDKQPASCDIAS